MDQGRKSKFQSNISVESRNSNLSHPRSLGRPSFDFPDINLQNKASLVYAMSIQSDNRKSDIFQRLLESQKKSSHRPSSIINSQTAQFNAYQTTTFQNQRNSDIVRPENQIEIDHQCACFENCLQNQCPCFQAQNQMCVKGTCCSKCLQLKTQILKHNLFNQHQGNFHPIANNNQAYQNVFYIPTQNLNNLEAEAPEAFFCNCKNTECLKSYCKCFQNGEFCSQKCGCESCRNKQHSEERYEALRAIKQYELTYCTCKKTKCNKKYCSCYASGIKCGKHCSCENCANCEKTNEMQIEVYEGEEEQDYKNAEMPERMSFEPVNFE